MKAFLVLCLIVALNCDVMSILMCLAANPKIMEGFTELINIIKEKETAKLFPWILKYGAEFASAIKQCLGK